MANVESKDYNLCSTCGARSNINAFRCESCASSELKRTYHDQDPQKTKLDDSSEMTPEEEKQTVLDFLYEVFAFAISASISLAIVILSLILRIAIIQEPLSQSDISTSKPIVLEIDQSESGFPEGLAADIPADLLIIRQTFPALYPEQPIMLADGTVSTFGQQFRSDRNLVPSPNLAVPRNYPGSVDEANVLFDRLEATASIIPTRVHFILTGTQTVSNISSILFLPDGGFQAETTTSVDQNGLAEVELNGETGMLLFTVTERSTDDGTTSTFHLPIPPWAFGRGTAITLNSNLNRLNPNVQYFGFFVPGRVNDGEYGHDLAPLYFMDVNDQGVIKTFTYVVITNP